MPPKQTPTPAPAPLPATPGPAAAANAADSPRPLDKKSAKAAKKKALSTQDAILISEIRDGMVIMRDGSVRAVVMCRSINFDLMSPQERDAVEFSYQGFLNSLYFPVQIFIRSQRVDLNNYIDELTKINADQDNILLSLLMEDYITYVRYLIEAANVMDKQFYIVVTYYPPLISQEGLGKSWGRITGLFKPRAGTITINEADYTRYKSELTQRLQTVLSGMNQLGVQAVALNTQELIELYYAVYNPETAAHERLADVDQLQGAVVQRGQGTAPPSGGSL